MRITTETYPSGVTATKIEPDEDYRYITNGNVWAVTAILGKSDSIGNWHDTNDEPPEPEDDEDATAEDYEEALGRFGV